MINLKPQIMDVLKSAVIALFKPFLFQKLPELFEELDKAKCDFANVNFVTSQLDMGTMNPFNLVVSQPWDMLEGLGDVKVFGISTTREQALEIVSGLRFQRFAKITRVTLDTNLEDLQDLSIEYQNIDVWKVMFKEQQQKLKTTQQPLP